MKFKKGDLVVFDSIDDKKRLAIVTDPQVKGVKGPGPWIRVYWQDTNTTQVMREHWVELANET